MNQVTDWRYDKESNLGHITINNRQFALYRECVGYRKNLTTPIYHYFVQVANDWNMSNRFTIESAQMRGLISKIEKHSYKLV
jgi:hypothetical protein